MPVGDVPGDVRDRAHERLDRPVARDDRGHGAEDRPPAPDLHGRARTREYVPVDERSLAGAVTPLKLHREGPRKGPASSCARRDGRVVVICNDHALPPPRRRPAGVASGRSSPTTRRGLQDGLRHLSARETHARGASSVRQAPRFTSAELRYLTEVDGDRPHRAGRGLGLARAGPDGVVAVARCGCPASRRIHEALAEWAIVVARPAAAPGLRHRRSCRALGRRGASAGHPPLPGTRRRREPRGPASLLGHVTDQFASGPLSRGTPRESPSTCSPSRSERVNYRSTGPITGKSWTTPRLMDELGMRARLRWCLAQHALDGRARPRAALPGRRRNDDRRPRRRAPHRRSSTARGSRSSATTRRAASAATGTSALVARARARRRRPPASPALAATRCGGRDRVRRGHARRRSGAPSPGVTRAARRRRRPGRHRSPPARTSRSAARAEQQITYLAYHDPLTGLPNRALLEEHLQLRARPRPPRRRRRSRCCTSTSTTSSSSTTRSATRAGDRAAAPRSPMRLRRRRARRDLLARHGGDEFLLLLADVARRRRGAPPSAAADQVAAALAEPFTVAGAEFQVGALASASRSTRDDARDADDAAQPRRRRDVPGQGPRRAAAGRSTRSGAHDPLERLSLPTRLRRALAARRARAALPADRRARRAAGSLGVEALLRWHDPERGLVLSGRVHPGRRGDGPDRGDRRLGASARSARQQVAWAAPRAGARRSRSTSRRASCAGPTSPRRVRDAPATRTGVDPALADDGAHRVGHAARTPASARADPARAARARPAARARRLRRRLLVAVAAARAAGATRSRSTARSCATCPTTREAAAIVTAILALARALGRTAVAEGVETEAQRALPRRAGLPAGPGLPARAADARRRRSSALLGRRAAIGCQAMSPGDSTLPHDGPERAARDGRVRRPVRRAGPALEAPLPRAPRAAGRRGRQAAGARRSRRRSRCGAVGARRAAARARRRRRARRRLRGGVDRAASRRRVVEQRAGRDALRGAAARAARPSSAASSRSGAASAACSRQSGHARLQQRPEARRVVHHLEVADLVLDDVVEHRLGREQQPPVERHRAGRRARRPARALARGSSGRCSACPARATAASSRGAISGARRAAVPALERRAARRPAGHEQRVAAAVHPRAAGLGHEHAARAPR